jgi:putative membrane protein
MPARAGQRKFHDPPSPEEEARRRDFESMMMDADRIMMQTVQTSMSLIGFGFSITTFFTDVSRPIPGQGNGQTARIVGAALLVIGLVLLTGGIWNQRRYRRELQVRYDAVSPGTPAWAAIYGRFTPSYLSAMLLMLVGLLSLASVIVRWLRLSLG